MRRTDVSMNWNKETYFLENNIYILTSLDRANDVNACTAHPFLSATSTSSNSNYIRRCYVIA